MPAILEPSPVAESSQPAAAPGDVVGDGKWVRAERLADWPDRCLACNRDARGRRIKIRYWWHHPAWLLTLFVVGPLGYAIIGLIVSRRSSQRVPICGWHRFRRNAWLVTGIGGLFLPFPVVLGLEAITGEEYPLLRGLAVVAHVFLPLISMACSRFGLPKRIENGLLWLKAGRAFRASVDADVFA